MQLILKIALLDKKMLHYLKKGIKYNEFSGQHIA